MTGQRIGYVRVSTLDQNTERQLDGLTLDKTYTDHASGKDTQRPQLALALSYVREGDTLIVHSMDRLSRSLINMLTIVEDLKARGVKVQFIKEHLTFGDVSDPRAELMLGILGSCAQFERALILERQREGIALARAKGVYTGRRGRKRVVDAEKLATIKERIANREPKASIARDLGISRETLYAYLRA